MRYLRRADTRKLSRFSPYDDTRGHRRSDTQTHGAQSHYGNLKEHHYHDNGRRENPPTEDSQIDHTRHLKTEKETETELTPDNTVTSSLPLRKAPTSHSVPEACDQLTPLLGTRTVYTPCCETFALERLSGGEANTASGERRSGLERISVPSSRVPLLHNGVTNSDSGRLQEVDIHYLEEVAPYQTPENLSRPSSSKAPPVMPSFDAGMVKRSPIRTLSEDRAHVSLRLGPLPISPSSESPPPPLPLSKAAGKKKLTKPPPKKRVMRSSPTQGINLHKRRVTKTQSSPRRKLLYLT
ncbi:hypothetical protein DY000_02010567 [Brassica cretica]|uniref:Uncharacterized protein n=1 Tax=Brassica cretica TaxID=69181 RepID=A0ABQ7C2A9_BRACR|nr:hypothetical protein DY000_02010567 [Brassica cretica]